MQTKKKSNLPLIIYLVVALILIVAAIVSGRGNPEVGLVGTGWALQPPILAIGLALITKEVYVSLFFGCAVGSLFISLGNPISATEMLFGTMIDKVSGNLGIVIFLVVLGIVVALMNKSGGSKAYGDWARKAIKTRKTAQLATFGLGVLIFVDDYFNCLTVGSVMRPVTDKHNVSRAKLSYLIDATAAPVCIIAPISSWAAAVASYVEDGPMAKFEKNAQAGDLFSGKNPYAGMEDDVPEGKGKVIDLVLPIVVLVFCCVMGMLYSGGFFTGTSWGTFGILIPITLSVFPLTDPHGVVCVSACMAGAVCGDHCSPISDTTIMASAGAQCDHVNHVSTQLPYAITCAAVSCVSYIVAGFVPSAYIALPVAILLMLGTLVVIKLINKGRVSNDA